MHILTPGIVSALGKVKLEIKYGDMQPQYISDDTLEDDSSTAQTRHRTVRRITIRCMADCWMR